MQQGFTGIFVQLSFFSFLTIKHICTPHLAQRAAEPAINNVQTELNAALERQKSDPTFIIPLVFEGPRREALPNPVMSIHLGAPLLLSPSSLFLFSYSMPLLLFFLFTI